MGHPVTNSQNSKLKRYGYRALNVWLVLHLFAIMITPMTIGASSDTSRRAWNLVSPYPRSLYLAHGFHYFAPEPGSSTLVKYEARLPNGEVVTGEFPNRDISPRLLYHRRFMLTEALGGLDLPERDIMIRAYANGLLHELGADQVSLTLLRHDLPTMVRLRVGGSLTDDDLYTEEFLGTFDATNRKPSR